MILKRRYIALASFVALVILFVLNLFSQAQSYSPNADERRYFEYCLLALELVLTIIVFRSKNNETKNMLTTLTVIITVLYMLLFFYFLIFS